MTMNVRDAIELLEADGWFLVDTAAAIANSKIRKNC